MNAMTTAGNETPHLSSSPPSAAAPGRIPPRRCCPPDEMDIARVLAGIASSSSSASASSGKTAEESGGPPSPPPPPPRGGAAATTAAASAVGSTAASPPPRPPPPPVAELRPKTTAAGWAGDAAPGPPMPPPPRAPPAEKNNKSKEKKKKKAAAAVIAAEKKREAENANDSGKFPDQLRKMMNHATHQDSLPSIDGTYCIAWTTDGRSIQIRDRKRFVDEVLPLFLKRRTQYASFVRKLYRWGFVRVDTVTKRKGRNAKEIFSNAHFVREDVAVAVAVAVAASGEQPGERIPSAVHDGGAGARVRCDGRQMSHSYDNSYRLAASAAGLGGGGGGGGRGRRPTGLPPSKRLRSDDTGRYAPPPTAARAERGSLVHPMMPDAPRPLLPPDGCGTTAGTGPTLHLSQMLTFEEYCMLEERERVLLLHRRHRQEEEEGMFRERILAERRRQQQEREMAEMAALGRLDLPVEAMIARRRQASLAAQVQSGLRSGPFGGHHPAHDPMGPMGMSMGMGMGTGTGMTSVERSRFLLKQTRMGMGMGMGTDMDMDMDMDMGGGMVRGAAISNKSPADALRAAHLSKAGEEIYATAGVPPRYSPVAPVAGGGIVGAAIEALRYSA